MTWNTVTEIQVVTLSLAKDSVTLISLLKQNNSVSNVFGVQK